MIMTIDGHTINTSRFQNEIIEKLKDTRKGGMAVLHGYSPDVAGKRYTTRPCYNATVITRFSISRMYARILEALEALQFEDINIKDEKLGKLSNGKLIELFNERKAFLIGRYSGQRENAHTEAHVRNYVRICDGVVGHLVSAYDKEAKKVLPVYDGAGNVTLRSIMLEGLLINRKMLTKGVAKPVNSQLKTRMGFAIEKALPRVSSDYRRFSLTPETVERVSIDTQTILPTELQSLID